MYVEYGIDTSLTRNMYDMTDGCHRRTREPVRNESKVERTLSGIWDPGDFQERPPPRTVGQGPLGLLGL